MAQPFKILVFGSTGAIGKELSLALIHRKVHFRAAVHTLSKADFLLQHKELVDIVEVDVTKPESIDKALDGIQKIFLLTAPGFTFASQSIIDAAKRHKVEHIVKLSAYGAHEEDKSKFFWAYEHRLSEESIVKEGIPLTSLRPTSFFTNIFRDAHNIKSQNSIYKLHGNAKMNWISNQDIAEAAVIILLDNGKSHYGKYYSITGPDTLSFYEIADQFTAELGHKINYVVIDEEQLKKFSSAYLPETAISGYVNMNIYFRNGGYDVQNGDLERIIGKKGKTSEGFHS